MRRENRMRKEKRAHTQKVFITGHYPFVPPLYFLLSSIRGRYST